MCKFQVGGIRVVRNAILAAGLTLLLALNWAWATVPIGLGAIERLDQISTLRPGVRTYQYSSHDPTGNHSDANNVLQTVGGEDVLLDVKGPGCIYRIWQTIARSEDPGGKTIRIYFDGSSTPQVNMNMAQFYGGSQAPFLSPLVGNNAVSSGGFYCYVPMPFRTGCKITLANGGAAKYYNITYQRFADATGITTFTGSEDTTAARNVWNNAGSDPKPDHGGTTISNTVNLANGSTATLANIATGGTVQELEITIPGLTDGMLTSVNLRAQWDGAPPAIDVPIGYFFGCGLGVRNVRGVPVGTDSGTKRMYCYLPMPFAASALIQLVNNSGQTLSNLNYTIRYTPQSGGLGECGYLNAKYLSETPTTWGRDYTILNETGGGHFIGVVHTLTGPAWGTDYYSSFMEGDERIHVDGSLTPQLYGTGTEDFYNGGYYFDRGTFTLPVHGNPIQTYSSTNSFACYRFLLSDLIPFTSSIKVGIEHNSVNNGTPNYYSVAFYYKSPQPLSTLTDTLDVGNSASESAHSYTISGATWSGTTNGYYEGDDDDIVVGDDGRRHAGYSQFVAAIDPANGGLLLRRRMDYSLPRQNAQVYVDGALAGEWYDAGNNNSKIFRDSEFLVPASLTQGKSSVTIKIVNASGESNWTEYRYWVYSLASTSLDMTLNVKPAQSITVDGNPSDWNLSEFTTMVRGGRTGSGDTALIGYDGGNLYYGSYYLSGVLPTSAADHTAKVYSRHDANYLYFLVRCDDSDMRYNNPASINWQNDCVEFFIDPGHDHGSTSMNASASDVQIDIDANNQKNVYMCTDAYKNQVLAVVTSAVVRDGTGWWLEARIAKTALDPDIATGDTIGMDFNFRDNDNNNDLGQTTIYTWADTTPNGESKVPDRWEHAFLDAPQNPYAEVIPLPGIIQAENYDIGGRNISYYDTTPGNTGSQYRSDDVDIEATTDTGGGYNVGWTAAGEWLEYTVDVAASGVYSINTRIACAGPGSFKIQMDGADVALKSYDTTGGWQNWTTIIAPSVHLTAGRHVVRYTQQSGNNNLNYIEFVNRGTDAVSIDLGNPDFEDGMNHISTGDGDTVPWTVAGHNCRENATASDNYIYFNVNDGYAYQGSKPNLYITFDYYDHGTGNLALNYDAIGQVWQGGGSVALTNTNTWKTYTFHVTDAYFGNRENYGADFRICGPGGGAEFGIDTVCVYQSPPDSIPPGNVTGFAAASGDMENNLSWTNPTDADFTGVRILCKTALPYPSGPNDPTATIIYDNAGTSYIHNGLTNGTTYYYKAFAHDGGPNYASGVQASAVPHDTGPPADVTGFTSTSGDTQVALSWTNPVSGFTGVKIMFKTTGYPTGPSDGTQVYEGNGTSTTHSGLANGTRYYYKAFAHDEIPNYASGVQANAVPAGPVTIDSSTFNTDANGWNLSTWQQGGVTPTMAWTGGAGAPPGAIECVGAGMTDGTTVATREGGEMWKVISTAPTGGYSDFHNINVSYDLKVNGLGNDYSGVGGVGDHNLLEEQLTISFSTDGGATWTEATYLNRNTLLGYQTWGTRSVDLSAFPACNNNPNFALKLRWQLNTGPESPSGADIADIDNVIIKGIGTIPDTTPPGVVTNLKAYGGNGQVSLSWTNPTDGDFAGTKLLAKTSGYPANRNDGTVVHNGIGTSCVNSGLANGTKYYYSAFTFDADQNYSAAVNATARPAADATIPIAKTLDDGEARALRGNIVTATFTGYFYIQNPTQPWGIRVSSPDSVSIGQKVDVVGIMSGQGLERLLDCAGNSVKLIDAGPITITPAALNNKAVGGANLNANTPGVVGGTGANNIGLLVRVCGKVTQTQAGQYFYVDDGCGLKDGTKTSTIDNIGVRINISPPGGVSTGKYVVVTGIVSPFDSSGLRRQILPLPQPAGVQIVGP